MREQTVFEALTSAGVPIDHHESDLYAKLTPVSAPIVFAFAKADGLNVTTFTHQVDGTTWFDIAFQYDPFWIAKARGTAATS